jgi:hypothetical protein
MVTLLGGKTTLHNGSGCQPWPEVSWQECFNNSEAQIPKVPQELVTPTADWCTQPWCYVDPCKCDAPDVRASSTFSSYGVMKYSYATCGAVGTYTSSAEKVGTEDCDVTSGQDMGPTDCYQHNMDVGGGANSCGYMDVLAIVAAEGEMKYDWYEGYFKNVPAEEIDSVEKCQAMCEHMPGCHFFVYSPPDPHADCTLKTGYAQDTCTPLYEALSGSHAGPSKCPSCIKEEMDVGGSFNACGFMDNVAVYAKPNVQKQSWYTGHYVELADVATWTVERCHGLCAGNPFCAYWHMSEDHCYLKADYSEEQKHAAPGGCVPLYNAFDVVREFKYSSGPAGCVHVQHMMTCGALKDHYKENMCCGQPSKMIETP